MRGVASVIPKGSDAHTHVLTPPCKSYYTHLRYIKKTQTQTLCTATKHNIRMGLKQACSNELHNHTNSLDQAVLFLIDCTTQEEIHLFINHPWGFKWPPC